MYQGDPRDEELRNVIFKFRFSPDCELPAHTHYCHAIAWRNGRRRD